MTRRSRAYLFVGHRTVEGWLEPEARSLISELGVLQVTNGVIGDIAEIGVHHGRLTILLANLARSDERVLAVDLFGDQHLNTDRSGAGDRRRFLANMSRWSDVSDNRLDVHQADSTTLTAQIISPDGRRFRMFSVDGGHTRAITRSDLLLASEVLAAEGIVILDDYFNPQWPEVSEGLADALAAGADLRPFAIGGNKVFLCREASHSKYLSAARDWVSHADAHAIDQTMHGSAVITVRLLSPTTRARRGVARLRGRWPAKG